MVVFIPENPKGWEYALAALGGGSQGLSQALRQNEIMQLRREGQQAGLATAQARQASIDRRHGENLQATKDWQRIQAMNLMSSQANQARAAETKQLEEAMRGLGTPRRDRETVRTMTDVRDAYRATEGATSADKLKSLGDLDSRKPTLPPVPEKSDPRFENPETLTLDEDKFRAALQEWNVRRDSFREEKKEWDTLRKLRDNLLMEQQKGQRMMQTPGLEQQGLNYMNQFGDSSQWGQMDQMQGQQTRFPGGGGGQAQLSPQGMSELPQGSKAQPIDQQLAGSMAHHFNVVMGLREASLDEYVRSWQWWADNTSVANMPEELKILATGVGGPPS